MGVLAVMAPVVPVAPAAVVVTVVVIPMVVSVMVVGVVVGRVRPEQMTPANRGRRSDAARRRRDRGQENEAEPHAAWTSPLPNRSASHVTYEETPCCSSLCERGR